MVVAFLINSLGYGGAERVFIHDANAFAEAGDSVLFFVLYGSREAYPQAKELDPRIRMSFLSARSAFDIEAMRRCARELKKSKAEALISTLNDGNIFARWVCLLMGKTRPHCIVREANVLSSKVWWQRALDRLCAGVPDRIIAISNDIYRSLQEKGGAFARKAVLLPNAVAVPIVREQPKGDILRILSVGSLTPQKDYPSLISALGMLSRDGIAFAATIVGRGSLQAALQARAEHEGIAEKMRFIGALPHDETLQQYGAADIFVLASRWEGSPNTVLEAMAAGLPVVATNVGGTPDFVLDQETGILVPPGDPKALYRALTSLARDPSLGSALGDAARNRITSHFSAGARLARLRGIVEAP